MGHEIMKAMKMETNAVIPISFKVPRKSEAFQEDLFPDCPAGVPSSGPDEWVSTAEAKPIVRRSMKLGSADASAMAQAAASSVAVVSVKDLKKQLADAEARIQALEKENEQLKAELTQLKSA